MPIGRYFVFSGSLLLALLFLADRYIQNWSRRRRLAGVDKTIIRLHTAHKWPEAIVFDTSLPTIVPPPRRPPLPTGVLPAAGSRGRRDRPFALAVPEAMPATGRASSRPTEAHRTAARYGQPAAHPRRIASYATPSGYRTRGSSGREVTAVSSSPPNHGNFHPWNKLRVGKLFQVSQSCDRRKPHETAFSDQPRAAGVDTGPGRVGFRAGWASRRWPRRTTP